MLDLRIPGPTACPKTVLAAMHRQMISHRSPDFTALLHNITERLRKVFCTNKSDLLLLSSSGTGAMEASVTNLFSPGDTVLAATCGKFGDRFADIAERFGARVVRLAKPQGQTIHPWELDIALRRHANAKGVLLVHTETSTGVTVDLEALARVARTHRKLIVVDAVSSLAVTPVRTDAWELDIVVTASQKGFMSPPGIALVAVSERAWQAHREARMSRYYFDFSKAKDSFVRGFTSFTPALATLYALDEALNVLQAEKMPRVYTRHRKAAQYTREGLRRLGFTLLAESGYAADAVTVALPPAGIKARDIIRCLADDHRILIADGQDDLAGKIIRIGHLGAETPRDMERCITAISRVLNKLQSGSTA